MADYLGVDPGSNEWIVLVGIKRAASTPGRGARGTRGSADADGYPVAV